MVPAPRSGKSKISTGLLPSLSVLLWPLLLSSLTTTTLHAAPTNTTPESISAIEDTDFTLNAANNALISVADPDIVDSQDLEVSIAIEGLGDIQLPSIADQLVFDGKISFSVGSGGEWLKNFHFQGSIDDLNTVLDGLVYRPMSDNAYTDILTITTTEPSSKNTDTDSVTITVEAVNDIPILTVPTSGSTVEEGDKVTFSSADEANLILVVDDATDSQIIQMQILVTNGTATLSGLADVNFVDGENGMASMTFQGTKSALNTAVDGLVFRPAIGFSGSATIEITVDDLGNEGSGGALSVSKQFEVTVTSANSAPVITVPATQSMGSGTTLTFSTAVGNEITVDDDASEDGSSILLSLAVGSGTLKLGSTTGITFIASEDESASLSLSGEVDNLQTALAGMGYTPNVDFAGVDTLSIDVDDQGNTGPGGVKTTSATVAINVVSSTPAPVNTVPSSVTANEDSAVTFSSASNTVSVSDNDTDFLLVFLQATSGTLTLSGVSNLSFDLGDGTEDNEMIFEGTLLDLNTALDGLVLQPVTDATSASVTVTTTENDGGSQSDSDTININFTPVNDAPVINFPSLAQQVPVNTAFVFSQSSGNAISISDDAVEDEAFVVLELTASNGSVQLLEDSALIPVGGANNSSNFTYVGDVNDFNAALNGMIFTPTTDYQGEAQITIRVNDQGSFGSGGDKEATQSFDFTVIDAGSPPVNSLPAAPSLDEDASLTFSSANGNAITVSDSDSSELFIDLEVSVGTLTLGSTAGISFTDGDGTADTVMVFSGTVANLNTALEGLMYQTQADVSADVTLTMRSTETVAPQLSDSDILTITVNSINDAPKLAIPAAQSVAEEGTLTFSSANSNAFGIIDDASESGASIEVQVSVSSGTVKLGQTAGLTITSGADESATVTFDSEVAAALAALEGIAYTPSADFNGSDQLQLRVNDKGKTGTGNAEEVTATVDITVTSVNDAPANSVPADQTLLEDATLTFSSANGNLLSVFDSDEPSASGNLTSSLQVTGGTLSLLRTAGLTFTTGDGTADASLAFQGTPDSLNTALAGMTYQPPVEFSGEITLTVETTDGDGATDTDSFKISISAVNDAPVVSLPASQSVAKEGTLTFNAANGNALSITDDASAEASIEVQLSVSNGTLKLGHGVDDHGWRRR